MASKGNQNWYQPVKNKAKGQTGKQNQSRCQLGNKAMKTETNPHSVKKKEKEKKERLEKQN